MQIKEYVELNIEKINSRISQFKKDKGAEYDETDIKNYLSEKFYLDLEENGDKWINEFKEKNCSKKDIITMANKYCLYNKHLEEFLINNLFKRCQHSLSKETIDKIYNLIENEANLSKNESLLIRNKLKKSLEKFLFLSTQNGFISNLNNLNSGTMVANAGDSAQFLFLSRAILAGYNCSNVDVRSSRYDAIIDYDDILFRVQVKGTQDTSVSFRDRPRGGRGIDYKDITNQGKYITTDDCDIYVAIDKQSGICYIIPTEDIEKLDPEKKGKVNISKLDIYKDNWDKIKELRKKMDD